MSADDKAAREARAKRLRQQVDQLAATGKGEKAPAQAETPREFIQRKMKEAQEKQPSEPKEE